MCEACDTMMDFNPYDEGFQAGIIAEQNRLIEKILNDTEQRWITNDFEIDEVALRRFVNG